MAAESLIKNHKRFEDEMLDFENGERLVGVAADGKVVLVDEDDAEGAEDESTAQADEGGLKWRFPFPCRGNKGAPRPVRMSLFVTNRRIVAYEANGFLAYDKYAELGLDEIEEILFAKRRDDLGGSWCVAEFVAKSGTGKPSIVFRLETDQPFDLEDFEQSVRTNIAQAAGCCVESA